MSNKYDKWPMPSSVETFEQYLLGHSRVAKIEKIKDNIYQFTRNGDLTPLTVIHSNIYILGGADVMELNFLVDNLQVIVLAGNWNSYTSDAKVFGKEQGIAIFRFREYFGALNFNNDEFINYLLPENRPKNKGKKPK